MTRKSHFSTRVYGQAAADYWWIIDPENPETSMLVSLIDDPLKLETPQPMGVFTGIGAKNPIIVSDTIYGTTITCSFLMVPSSNANGFAPNHPTSYAALQTLRSLRALGKTLLLKSPINGTQYYFRFGSGSAGSSGGSSSGQYTEIFYSPSPGNSDTPIQVDVTIIQVDKPPAGGNGPEIIIMNPRGHSYVTPPEIEWVFTDTLPGAHQSYFQVICYSDYWVGQYSATQAGLKALFANKGGNMTFAQFTNSGVKSSGAWSYQPVLLQAMYSGNYTYLITVQDSEGIPTTIHQAKFKIY